LVESLEVGGTETQAVQTALRQAAAGHQVSVGCLRSEGPLIKVVEEAGIPVTEFCKGRKLLSLKGIRQLLRLTLFLRQNRVEVLHCHDLMSNLLGVPAARVAGTAKIISSRRYFELEWWSGWLRTRIAGLIYKLSHHVIVNSTFIRDLLVHRDHVRSDKIDVLYNGIDIKRFSIVKNKISSLAFLSQTSTIIAVVANMYSPVKGHTTLIKAAVEVCRELPDVLFALIGDGKERPSLERQAIASGLGRNFLFLGSRQDVPELLACCDISVLPSDSEGFPNAILEAMAAHLPVIATRVGGVPEVVDDEVTGLLVPPADPAALSAAILRVLKDQGLRKRLAEAGHNLVAERFSFEQLTSSLEALYGKTPQRRTSVRDLRSLKTSPRTPAL
jgi:glycosyltransferase involved in cell wall biosynthesis